MTTSEHRVPRNRAAATGGPGHPPTVLDTSRAGGGPSEWHRGDPHSWPLRAALRRRSSTTVRPDEAHWLIVLATTGGGLRPATHHPATTTCQTVTQIDNAHFCLLALAETMHSRYTHRDTSEHGERPRIVVSVDDLAALREQLIRLWRQISTEQQPATSPALHALEQLHRYGQPVGIHLETARLAQPNGRRRATPAPRWAARTAQLWRRCDTVWWAA